MKEIILQVPDREYGFLMKLVQSLKFVKVTNVEQGDDREHILQSLRNGLDEMKEIESGQKKGTPLNKVLNGL